MATYTFERTDTREKVEFQANGRKIARATAIVKLGLLADQTHLARQIGDKKGRNHNGNKAGRKHRRSVAKTGYYERL